jgi:hypothetical protein
LRGFYKAGKKHQFIGSSSGIEFLVFFATVQLDIKERRYFMKARTILMIPAVIMALSSCATMTDTQRGTAQGTAIGAGAGAAIGALIGGGKGAAIGAAQVLCWELVLVICGRNEWKNRKDKWKPLQRVLACKSRKPRTIASS